MHRSRAPHDSCPWLAILASLILFSGATTTLAEPFGGNNYFFSQIFLPPTPVIENFERLGSSFAVGDFDNDGFEDLAVGEPNAEIMGNPNAGQVYIFFSSGNTQTFSAPLSFDPGSSQSGVRFAYSLAAGDFNLDGIEDLAIGVPDSPRFFAPSTGEVQIRFGGDGGFSGSGQVIELEVPQGLARFGFAMVGIEASTNGLPGLADTLLVGVPGLDFDPGTEGSITAAGALAFFSATPSGLALEAITFQNGFGGAVETDDAFAAVLAAGDFNGDGIDDFAIAAPREDIGNTSDAGAVSLAISHPKGWTTSVLSQNDLPGSLAEANDGFGTALAIGDFNGDQYDDLAIGTPLEGVSGATGAGLVQVIPADMTSLDLASASTWSQESTGVAVSEADDFFGAALQAGDFNGDGRDDLAIGIPFEDFGEVDTGATVALFGTSSAGLSSTGAKLLTQATAGGTNEPSDLFGSTLAAGDFDNDGMADLAIGVPAKDSGAIDAGAFFVLFGEGLFKDDFEAGSTTAWSLTFP